jgi:glycosyltransferase involved in cell wall biosynthesis
VHFLHFLPVYAPAWQFGGPVLSVSRMCEGLAACGAQVSVITTNAGLPSFPETSLAQSQVVNGVNVTYYRSEIRLGHIWSTDLIQNLPAHLNSADLVHLSSIWQPLGIEVQKYAHIYQKPIIQTPRGALSPYSFRQGWWKKIPYYFLRELPYLKKAAALHYTSLQEKQESDALHLNASSFVLPNYVDLSQLYTDTFQRLKFRSRLQLSDEDTLFVVVGRMHHKKGLNILPETFHNLPADRWHILFVGSQDDQTVYQLKKSFSRFHLSTHTTFMDTVPAGDLLSVYNAADWLLLPSLHENFGNVVPEALSCGCGVIISDQVGSARDIAECPGTFVLPRIINSWARQVNNCMSIRRPGTASETWINEYFSRDNLSQKLLLHYQGVLENA